MGYDIQSTEHEEIWRDILAAIQIGTREIVYITSFFLNNEIKAYEEKVDAINQNSLDVEGHLKPLTVKEGYSIQEFDDKVRIAVVLVDKTGIERTENISIRLSYETTEDTDMNELIAGYIEDVYEDFAKQTGKGFWKGDAGDISKQETIDKLDAEYFTTHPESFVKAISIFDKQAYILNLYSLTTIFKEIFKQTNRKGTGAILKTEIREAKVSTTGNARTYLESKKHLVSVVVSHIVTFGKNTKPSKIIRNGKVLVETTAENITSKIEEMEKELNNKYHLTDEMVAGVKANFGNQDKIALHGVQNLVEYKNFINSISNLPDGTSTLILYNSKKAFHFWEENPHVYILKEHARNKGNQRYQEIKCKFDNLTKNTKSLQGVMDPVTGTWRIRMLQEKAPYELIIGTHYVLHYNRKTKETTQIYNVLHSDMNIIKARQLTKNFTRTEAFYMNLALDLVDGRRTVLPENVDGILMKK